MLLVATIASSRHLSFLAALAYHTRHDRCEDKEGSHYDRRTAAQETGWILKRSFGNGAASRCTARCGSGVARSDRPGRRQGSRHVPGALWRALAGAGGAADRISRADALSAESFR